MTQPTLNPAFRAHCFLASVIEGVWPGAKPSRLHRNLVRHGRRVGYERIGRDPWQVLSGMWPATEEEAAEFELRNSCSDLLGGDLPF